MARDKGLEELVGMELAGRRGVSEKAMFGGWAWLWNGNLLAGARHDGLLLRLGKENERWALKMPGIGSMISGKRRMGGWVRVTAEAYGDDALRERLITAALGFVAGLPAK